MTLIVLFFKRQYRQDRLVIQQSSPIMGMDKLYCITLVLGLLAFSILLILVSRTFLLLGQRLDKLR